MKITILNKNIFVEKSVLTRIVSFQTSTEKIGYLFFYKNIDVEEYIVNDITPPHPNDISTEVFSEISRKHLKIAKNIVRNNSKISIIGFYHTHPVNFGTCRSDVDVEHFAKTSKKREISLFIIVSSKSAEFYVYS